MTHEKILYALVIAAIFLLVGTMYYHHQEAWSYTDSFYFSTMTLTTIGYGDLVPTQTSTKIFTSIYAVIGIGIIVYLLGNIVGAYMMQQEKYFDIFMDKLHELNARLHKRNKAWEEVQFEAAKERERR